MNKVTHVDPQDLTKKNSPVLQAESPPPNSTKSQEAPVCYYNGNTYQVGAGICVSHEVWRCGWYNGNYGWIRTGNSC
jgi:hypothetical protein